MQRPDFAEIMQMKSASVESMAGRAWTVRNHNRLLWTFPGALGGKTRMDSSVETLLRGYGGA